MTTTSDATLASVALIDDRLTGGALLVVGGSKPLVARVLGLRAGGVVKHDMRTVDGEYYGPGELWPDLVPVALRGNQWVMMVPAANLRPVDIVWVWFGTGHRGTERGVCYLWQPQNRKQAMVPVGRTASPCGAGVGMGSTVARNWWRRASHSARRVKGAMYESRCGG